MWHVVIMALLWPLLATAEQFALPVDRPIVVRADSAANDPDANITTFRGHFELQGADWPMQADAAIIYGPVENPERIVVTGTPAKLWLARKGVERAIAAQAEHIEYVPGQALVRLQGNARLVEEGRRVMEGDQFEFNLDTRKLTQKGKVHISVLPKPSLEPASESRPDPATEQPPR